MFLNSPVVTSPPASWASSALTFHLFFNSSLLILFLNTRLYQKKSRTYYRQIIVIRRVKRKNQKVSSPIFLARFLSAYVVRRSMARWISGFLLDHSTVFHLARIVSWLWQQLMCQYTHLPQTQGGLFSVR